MDHVPVLLRVAEEELGAFDFGGFTKALGSGFFKKEEELVLLARELE